MVRVTLSKEDTDLLSAALEAFRYWQCSDEVYRKDGHVLEPGSENPQLLVLAKAAHELEERVKGVVPDRTSLTPEEVRLVRDALDAYMYATTGSFEPDKDEEIERARQIYERLGNGQEDVPAVALVFPVVHLNGTPRQRLLDGYCEAKKALQDALDKIIENGPNARDYYLRPGTYEKAREQHAARCASIRNQIKDLEKIAEHIADA